MIFVDAALGAPREVQLQALEPAGSSQIMAHAADPRTLLALACDVFGHVPQAWWLTIPVENLGAGEELSPLAQQGFAAALEMLRKAPKKKENSNRARHGSGPGLGGTGC